MNLLVIFIIVAVVKNTIQETSTIFLPLETNCGTLPEVEGHRILDGKNVAGSSRKFECLPNYRLVGADSVTCTEEGKWSFGGSCLKKVVDCGPRPTPTNCDEQGYSLDFTTICGEDGIWIVNKKCHKDCGKVPVIQNGSISIGQNSFGSIREVVCHDGFELDGIGEIICGENGTWTEAPFCREVEEITTLVEESYSGSGGNDDELFKQDEINFFEKPIVGNVSCFDDENATNDTTAVGYYYFADRDRCNGKYDCLNGADENNCREKCIGWRYPTRDDVIDCRAAVPMYYFDFETGKCEFFLYGGCAEVQNMFLSPDECQRECAGILIRLPPVAADYSILLANETAINMTTDQHRHNISTRSVEDDDDGKSAENDDDDTIVIEMETEVVHHGNISCDPFNLKATEFYYETDRCDGIYVCSNGEDELNCTNKCYGWKYPSENDVEHCRASIPMFFFDSGKCVEFVYGGCYKTSNLFRDLAECERECKDLYQKVTTVITTKLLDNTVTSKSA